MICEYCKAEYENGDFVVLHKSGIYCIHCYKEDDRLAQLRNNKKKC